MNRWQRFKQWLSGLSVATISGGLQELLKILVPIGTVLIVIFGPQIGMTFNQVVVSALGLLGSDALIERFFSLNRIEKGILSISTTQMPKIEKAVESVALTNATFQLGLAGITSRWTDFREFQQPFGERLRQQLEQSEGATWYIVTTSPLAFLDWQKYFTNAVENRKVDIKWVYHSLDVLRNCPAIRVQALMLFGQVPDWQEREQHLEKEWGSCIESLDRMMSQSESRIRSGSKLNAGTWELYESTIPHFFMAFLSVPKKQQNISVADCAPEGTFGFIHLYTMFPRDYHDRPAMYFEAPGSFTDTYYRSIVSMFNEHKDRGYIQRKHPQDKEEQHKSDN